MARSGEIYDPGEDASSRPRCISHHISPDLVWPVRDCQSEPSHQRVLGSLSALVSLPLAENRLKKYHVQSGILSPRVRHNISFANSLKSTPHAGTHAHALTSRSYDTIIRHRLSLPPRHWATLLSRSAAGLRQGSGAREDCMSRVQAPREGRSRICSSCRDPLAIR